MRDSLFKVKARRTRRFLSGRRWREQRCFPGGGRDLSRLSFDHHRFGVSRRDPDREWSGRLPTGERSCATSGALHCQPHHGRRLQLNRCRRLAETKGVVFDRRLWREQHRGKLDLRRLLRHLGQMIGAAELPGEGLQRLHILDNRFSNRPYLDNQNGYEVLQIGWSAMRGTSLRLAHPGQHLRALRW